MIILLIAAIWFLVVGVLSIYLDPEDVTIMGIIFTALGTILFFVLTITYALTY